MSFLNVKNNAASTLASGITDSATTLTVATGQGALFPSSNFHITIDDEIILCSSRSSDVLTIERAKEGTAAAAHSSGAAVRLNITAQHISELQSALVESHARAYRNSSVQAIPDNAWTKVELNAEDYDSLDQFDSTTNYRFTAQIAGWYLVVAGVTYSPVVADKRYIMGLYKNGATICNTGYHASQTGAFYMHTSEVVYLDVDDYLELWTIQQAGVEQNVYYGSPNTFMGVHRLPI